jgi:predicted chitinase
MSTIGQQRSAVQTLANALDFHKLKRAGVTTRQSEAEHLVQMLHDAAQTLNGIKEPAAPPTSTW